VFLIGLNAFKPQDALAPAHTPLRFCHCHTLTRNQMTKDTAWGAARGPATAAAAGAPAASAIAGPGNTLFAFVIGGKDQDLDARYDRRRRRPPRPKLPAARPRAYEPHHPSLERVTGLKFASAAVRAVHSAGHLIFSVASFSFPSKRT